MADLLNVQSFRHAAGGGDTPTSVDLALKEFANMVIRNYDENLMIDMMHRTVNVSGGAHSYQFPVMGTGEAFYHQAGHNLLVDEDEGGTDYNNKIPQGERIIYADKKLVASQFVDDLDEKIIHYEYRSMLAMELARAIRVKSEENKLRVLYNTGLIAADALFAGSLGGTTIENGSIDTSADIFVGTLFEAKKNMDEDDIPRDGRNLLITPDQSKLLFAEASALPGLEWLNKDYSGAGSIADGRVARLAGFNVYETNHLPVTAGTTHGDDYNIFDTGGTGNDYETILAAGKTTAGIAFHTDAIATVSLMGLKIAINEIPEYLGHLITVTKCEGTGPLRPECVNILRHTN